MKAVVYIIAENKTDGNGMTIIGYDTNKLRIDARLEELRKAEERKWICNRRDLRVFEASRMVW